MTDLRDTRWGLLVVIVVAALGFMALFTGNSAWATPDQDPLLQTVPTPPPGGSVTTIGAGQSGSLSSPTGDVNVNFPAGSVTEDMNFMYTPLTEGEIPEAGVGFRFIGHAFSLAAYRGLDLVPGFVFAVPVQLCINFTDEEAAAAGGAANLRIEYYDTATGTWVELDTTITDNTACTTITHLTTFALMARVPEELPVTGSAPGLDSKIVLLAIVVAGAITGGAWLMRGRRVSL